MKRVLIALTLFALVAGVAHAATPQMDTPPQTVNATIAAAYSITVSPASVSFPNFQQGLASCQTEGSTVVTIVSSSTWSLRVMSDASGIYLRNGGGPLASPLQVAGGALPFTDIAGDPGLVLLSAQAATASQAVPTQYRQCVNGSDAAGSYSLGVIYRLGP